MNRATIIGCAISGLLLLLYFAQAQTHGQPERKKPSVEEQLSELRVRVEALRGELKARDQSATFLTQELDRMRELHDRAERDRVRHQVHAKDHVETAATAWSVLLAMKSLRLDKEVHTLFLFKAGGMQAVSGNNTHPVGLFRLTVDDEEKARARHEFRSNDGWRLRDVSLVWLEKLKAGEHRIAVEWCVVQDGDTLHVCWHDDARSLVVIADP